jgi:hypothetical protein
MADRKTAAERSAEQARTTEEATGQPRPAARGEREAPRPRFEGVGGPVSDEDRLSGPTHADDATYEGVKMEPAEDGPVTSERSGPEDALGLGPKRGHYEHPDGYEPHEVLPVAGAKPGEPTAVSTAQKPRTEDVGDETGKKGGVETHTPERVKEEAEKASAGADSK